MTCEEALILAAADAYGDAPPDDRAALAAHTAMCASCAAQAKALRDTAARLSSLAPFRPAPFWARQRAEILQKIQRRPSAARWLWAPVLAAAVFALWPRHAEPPAGDFAVACNMDFVQNLDMMEHLDILERLDELETL